MQAACREGCLGDVTYLGENALVNNSGGANTAVGGLALFDNTTGYVNTAVGSVALFGNTSGIANTAVGAGALQINTTGFQNTATGQSALQDNNGFNNTADGYNALFFNTTGNNNTAVGSSAVGGNADIQATGSNNAATGYFALRNDTTGNNNTAIGANALTNNTTGTNNIALGVNAGFNLTTGSNNIDIGNRGAVGESNHIRIGIGAVQTDTFIAGISGVTVPNGVGVIVNPQGHLGTIVSSERFKENIQPMDNVSEAVLALKPVTFHYNQELDPEGIPQFGLVAEDVERVKPDLVARDEEGKPYTVRYEAVNTMLLNEFLKEHRKVEKLEAALEAVNKRLKEQDAQIQKVSAQLEVSKPSPHEVANNP